MARLQAVIVFPTPPLPELTAIERATTRLTVSRDGPARRSRAIASGPGPGVSRPAVGRAISAHVQRRRRRPALPPSLEGRIELLPVEEVEEVLEVFLLDLQEQQ